MVRSLADRTFQLRLAHVRYAHVSSAFVRDVLMKEPMLLTPPGQKMVFGALASVLEASTPKNPARLDGLALFAIGGSAAERNAEERLLSSVECYDPSANVAESGRRLTRSKLLARRPHSGGHWPGGKKIE